MANSRFETLLQKFVKDTISPAEVHELGDLMSAAGSNEELDNFLASAYADRSLAVHEDFDGEKVREKILARLQFGEPQSALPPANDRRTFRLRWLAAACLAGLLGLAAWFWALQKNTGREGIDPRQVAMVASPQTNKAILTLADGSDVYLDSVNNGQLAIQGRVKLLKLGNGRIAYEYSSDTTDIVHTARAGMNTLTNPRGSEVIEMKLPDSTRVWLNVGSSLSYPVAFEHKERTVILKGEAYFEVAPDKTKPFRVKITDNTEIAVLGTHFNVNAYEDEPALMATLLEGAIQFKKDNKRQLLQPGQQVRSGKDGTIRLVPDADIQAVMAWKRGFFHFDKTDLPTIMRQMERWYDVTVEFQGKVTDMRFSGEISRTHDAFQVLKILEASGAHFKIEGKKIIVLPE
ncbi:FecR family protein [Chitinophaga cymbidii]|uniref:Iron dicitrate transporter FecR n=1 Tax=Chitinophaga cymbidii TaxID=1096750 RepID=A0A512RPK9_9BACT|nr:FecR family protein [Chitinophaga cymbidii]GEP97630.1 iron dicitrate transporter FecR [Chitinophaga cymbidii]